MAEKYDLKNFLSIIIQVVLTCTKLVTHSNTSVATNALSVSHLLIYYALQNGYTNTCNTSVHSAHAH